MKKTAFTLSAIFAVIAAVGSAWAQTETRTVQLTDSYNAINISGTQDVYFEIGPAGEPLTVIGEAAELDKMEIKVVNGTLSIGHKKGHQAKSKVKVYAKNPTLKGGSVSGTGTLDIRGTLDSSSNKFSVSGTGDVKVEKIDCSEATCSVSGTGNVICPDVKVGTLTVKVSGTGTVDLDGIEAKDVEVKSSGTGNIYLTGNCWKASMSTSGTGNINAADLLARNVTATTSGTGNINCHCAGSFEGRTSGTGRISLSGGPENTNYRGNPRQLHQK